MKAYLDNGATTQVSDQVVAAMQDVFQNIYGNPSSMHRMGVQAEKLLKQSKRIIAKHIKATPEEIYFTSGGTEANNLAIQGYLKTTRKKKIITSAIEHPSVLNVFLSYRDMGYDVILLPVDKSGHINQDDLKNALDDQTALVSIMYVNNEIGTIQDIRSIGTLIKKHSQAKFHVDAVQALGKLDCNVKKLGVDMMSISSHKIHGPKGVGALFIKKDMRIEPLFLGGSQEKAIRPGTENLPGIVGFAKACELLNASSLNEHLQPIKEQFVKGVLDIPLTQLNGDDGVSHIVNVSFPKMRGEVLLHVLESNDIYVSTGSACTSKTKTYSHVLEAIGLDDAHKEGAIRFSFSKYTTVEMIDYTLEVLKKSVADLDMIIKGR